MFVGDLVLIGYLTMRAYRDGKSPFYDEVQSFLWGNLLMCFVQRIPLIDVKSLSLGDLRVVFLMMNKWY
jgi:hypothetical protein